MEKGTELILEQPEVQKQVVKRGEKWKDESNAKLRRVESVKKKAEEKKLAKEELGKTKAEATNLAKQKPHGGACCAKGDGDIRHCLYTAIAALHTAVAALLRRRLLQRDAQSCVLIKNTMRN